MIEDELYIEHSGSRMMFEAMFSRGLSFLNFREQTYSSNSDHSPIRKRSISPEIRKGETEVKPFERFKGKQMNYREIAEKNAQELINEEEKAKIKTEKKKAKRERRRLQKMENNDKSENVDSIENTINNMSSEMESLCVTSDCKDAEGLDINAAFMTRAIKKVKHLAIIPEKTPIKKVAKDINTIIKTAVEYENNRQFKEAVQCLSDALNLSPKRFDLILKRSFLYYKLDKFEKSIRDAQKALQYSPNNADGYLRLAEGQFALNNLSDAEAAFIKLLNFKSYCKEAGNRLFSIRVKQLEVMGYHPNVAFTALLKSKNKTLVEAIDYLTDLESGKETANDLYYSDEDESEEDYEEDDNNSSEGACGPLTPLSPPKPVVTVDKTSPLLTDPSNPLRCRSIFVGNLKKGITYKEVQNVFKQFGRIINIKLTTRPNCYAFVNFEEIESAGRAMAALQGSLWHLSTIPLIVKYPINSLKKALPTLNNPDLLRKLGPLQAQKTYYKQPIFKLADKESDVIKSVVFTPTVHPPNEKAAFPAVPVKKEPEVALVKPPASDSPCPSLQTAECFYCRTEDCVHGEKCIKLHIFGHEDINMKIRKPLSLN